MSRVRTASPDIEVRHDLRPGDIGTIVYLHGTLYANECGWDHTFEAYVAEPLGAFAKRSNTRERIWLVDFEGQLCASIAIVEVSAAEAQLRWLLVKPELRGSGIGRGLVREAIAFCRASGYRSLFLWTVKELTVAGRLYASFGFRVTAEHAAVLWGRRVTEQRYALAL